VTTDRSRSPGPEQPQQPAPPEVQVTVRDLNEWAQALLSLFEDDTTPKQRATLKAVIDRLLAAFQPQASVGVRPAPAAEARPQEGILTLREARDRVRKQADEAEARRQEARDRDAAKDSE
jgi:hypothetical protein